MVHRPAAMLTTIATLVMSITATSSASGDQRQAFYRDLDLLYAAEAATVTADYHEMPLRDVLEDLADESGLTLRGMWDALEYDSIEPDDAVTLTIGSVSLAHALLRLSEDLSDGWHQPRVTAYDGAILLTSRVNQRRNFNRTAMYDVRDLLDHPNDPEDPEEPHADDGHQFTRADIRAYRLDDLIDLIIEMVEPDAWEQHGGDFSRILAHKERLIVNTDLRNHRKIGEMLDQLRHGRDGRANLAVAVLDLPRSSYRSVLRRHAPDSPLLARSIMDHEQAVVHSRVSSPVAVGEPLDVRTKRETIDLTMRLTAHRARGGGLDIGVAIETRSSFNEREQIQTSVSWTNRSNSAIFELVHDAGPTGIADDDHFVRLIVLKPRLRTADDGMRPSRMEPGGRIE